MEVTPAPPPAPYTHRPWKTAGRMVSGSFALLPLVFGTLIAGMLIYHLVEHLAWPDSFLNAAMLLGGMGPVDQLHTTLGKWLAGLYALFSGLVVIVVAGAMLAPVFHHVLTRHHLDMHEREKPKRG